MRLSLGISLGMLGLLTVRMLGMPLVWECSYPTSNLFAGCDAGYTTCAGTPFAPGNYAGSNHAGNNTAAGNTILKNSWFI